MNLRLHHTLIVMAVALISSHTWAQQKFPISFNGEGAKSRWVQQHIIDVDDVAGTRYESMNFNGLTRRRTG